MKTTCLQVASAVVALALFAGAGQATILVTHTNSETDIYSPLPDDALGGSATVTGTHVGFGGAGSPVDFTLFNDDLLGDTAPIVNFIQNGSTITYAFDVVSNPAGYDITEIASYAGWDTTSGGRSNQGYQIDLTFVDDTTATLLPQTTLEPNNPAMFWTRVLLDNDVAGMLSNGLVSATGVKAVTFKNFVPANADSPENGEFSNYREFDIVGTATVPEPATLGLLTLGGLMIGVRPRGRETRK